MLTKFEFANPEFLWLLALLPIIALWHFITRKKDIASITFSNTSSFGSGSILAKLRPVLYVLRIVALGSLIIALARPRNKEVTTKSKSNKGIDIVMAIDVSASMLAKDLKPNRLEALKKVASNFVDKRPNDRIGIVVYAGESFTQTPITSDKRIIKNTIKSLKWGQLEGGTAIGMGLGSGVNRLKDSKAKSKVIILLTDGVSNAGSIDPKTATELAKSLNIKVYTIGLGTNGMAETPVSRSMDGRLIYRSVPVTIDETLLKHIAKETEGKYFRATSNTSLNKVYEDINKLEKTTVEEFKYTNYQEMFRVFVLFAGLLILIEMLLRFTVFRSFV